jgi:membrane protein DedA with SNARE-associated domain
MNLFVDYVQPLTDWLQNNPSWSLFITFFIALTESLAIIGSIVPGSVTMTAIGILAGSGIMPIDLTLLAAVLGAVAGDSLSYALGYVYSEQLTEMWPFSKYPKWLHYGKDFFEIHGGKSVLIGRFVGPLRSIIPVIAGILHMKHWRFLIANIISAIGWSLLYIIPGVIIGAASHELSTESATRLFVLILVLLVCIWLFSLLLKWIVRWLSSYLKPYLHRLWLKLKNNALLIQIYNAITPKNETDHYPTAALALCTIICLLCFTTLLALTISTDWLSYINLPSHLFFQSFNTELLKLFAIFCTQLTCTATIICLFSICCCWFAYHKNFSTILYLLILIVYTGLLALLLTHIVNSPRPPGLLVVLPGSSFPPINLAIATALYGFILFYINNNYILPSNTLKTTLFIILSFSGFSSVYLGDYWISDIFAAYFVGAIICLVICLIYRKANWQAQKKSHSSLMVLSLFIGIILSSSISTYINFYTLSYNHTPYHKEILLNEDNWWQQKKPILQTYQLSRIGKRISILNIQFAGNIDELQNSLMKNGWESHTDSFFTNLLMLMNKQADGVKLPLFSQLYENKSPVLMMTYTDKQSKLALELRVWESNYNLIELNKALWIGSVHSSIPVNNQKSQLDQPPKLINPLNYLFPNEHSFLVRQIIIPDIMIKRAKYPTQPYIILIKSKQLQ